MMPILESGEETLVGGQAVIEGVMMRAPHSYCVAVRKPSGEIVTEEKPLARMSEKHRIFKYPVLRGVGTLCQAMSLGLRALKFSANSMLETESPKAEPKEIPNWAISLNLLFSFAFFIFLYKFVPLYAVTALGKWYPLLKGRIAFNATDGFIRIAIFLAFLFLISRMKDIHRVFEYHGAEHKVVFNFESGKPVTVENAQAFTTFHPRCGTSFLMVVMVVSMVVYTLIPFSGFGMKLLSRVAAAALHRGHQLRVDPLRRQTPRIVPGHPHRPRPVAAAHHHQAAIRRAGCRGHPRARRRHGA